MGRVDRTWWSAGRPLAEFSRRNFPSISALQRSGRTKSLFFGSQSSHSSPLSFMSAALCRVRRPHLHCPSHSMRSSRLLPSFPSWLFSGGTTIPPTSGSTLSGTSLSSAKGVGQLVHTIFLAHPFPDSNTHILSLRDDSLTVISDHRAESCGAGAPLCRSNAWKAQYQ